MLSKNKAQRFNGALELASKLLCTISKQNAFVIIKSKSSSFKPLCVIFKQRPHKISPPAYMVLKPLPTISKIQIAGLIPAYYKGSKPPRIISKHVSLSSRQVYFMFQTSMYIIQTNLLCCRVRKDEMAINFYVWCLKQNPFPLDLMLS